MKIKNKALYRKITAAIACGLMFSMSSAVAYAGGEAPKKKSYPGNLLYGVDDQTYTYATERPIPSKLDVFFPDTNEYPEVAVAVRGGLSHKKPDGDTVLNHEFAVMGSHYIAVAGGYVPSGNASDVQSNKVTIKGNANVYDLFGGYASSGNAINNEVVIIGGDVAYAFGGFSVSGNATDNTVTLGDVNAVANISRKVYINATWSQGEGFKATDGGTLNVYNSGNKIDENLYAKGANVNFYINASDMNANGSNTMLQVGGIADLTGATVKAGVIRNVADVANVANGNKITLLSAGTLKADGVKCDTMTVTDGIADINLSIKKVDNKIIATAGDGTSTTSMDDDSVVGNGVSLTSLDDATYSDNNANTLEDVSLFLVGVDYKDSNTYTQVTQGADKKIVAVAAKNSNNEYNGGLSSDEPSADDSASGHVFTVRGGDFLMVMGGFSSDKDSQNNVVKINDGNISTVSGGFSFDGSANNNTVIISGGNVECVTGGLAYKGSANNNTVIISGGTVENVCGGYSAYGSATGNTVTLGNANSSSGVANITEDVVINSKYDDDVFSKSAGGCTLNVYNSGNNIGGNLYADKANVNFYVNAADFNADGSKTMLKVDKTADLTGATVKASIRNIGDVASGSKITLLSAGTLKDYGASYGTLTDGIGAIKLDKSDKQIMVTISSSKNKKVKLDNSSPAKSPVETVAANIDLINTGSDMLAGQGMDSASDAIASNQAAGGSASSMAPFACVGGGSLKLKSGSYVDLKSWNFNLGFAKEIKNNSGKLLFGPVFEYGRGNYESHLDIGTVGTGKSNYFGAGFMAKQTFNKGTYVEGSARIGRAKSDYKGALNGKDEVTYDNSTTYYAVHLGVGREVDLNAADSFDYYGKLFYSHQNGSTAHLSNNYDYDFAATNSLRTRLGFRYTHKTNDFSKYYAGLAWQHEFSSKCEADIRNNKDGSQYIAPAPGMKGDTGILELGVKLKPNKSDKFEVDLGLAGYAGKQQGITANAQFLFKF